MPLRVRDEIRDALAAKRPVVALETTILSHGMPYPRNLETARAVEAIVRDAGAVPATIAVFDGAISVGLDDEQLARLATARDVMKLSRADLPYAIAERRVGATTVAATMICAHLAGIEVFATGGIGGVHRGAETSFDVSADLHELARTPVAVVCAGAKALLDVPKTLEVLETLGVPVIAYGSDDFPAFWSRSSGLRAPLRYDDAAGVARFIRTARATGMTGGALVAQPNTYEAEIPRAEMETVIARALDEAAREGVTGKAVTPWLLDRIYHLTAGRSLESNIALVCNNARLAAEIAVALGA
ncbi:MAG: pseudouridine-5'-phosphate glycosidase [bacterium]|nr:pseudouridine-5'-phosphate glycosidase [bacterium]